MGEVHTSGYLRVRRHYPDCEGVARLVVAADESERRARHAVENLGFERWTTDWHEVIADPEVEAVSITAPNFAHREIAIAAAEAGKHFWGEKPLGRFPWETEDIARAAEAAGVRTIVGLNYRQPPAVAYARQLIAEGALGEITHFRSQFVAGYSKSPHGALSWRFLRDLAGLGILGDLMTHAVDLAQFLLGSIGRVTTRTTVAIPERPRAQMGEGTHFAVVDGAELGPVENEDIAWSLVEFERGLVGTIEASRVIVGPEARYMFEVNGARGAVAWDFERLNELELHLSVEGGAVGYSHVIMGPQHPEFVRFQPGPGISMGYDDLKVIEAARFLQSVADGEQREPGVREMLAAACVIDAMDRSSRSLAWEDVGEISRPREARKRSK